MKKKLQAKVALTNNTQRLIHYCTRRNTFLKVSEIKIDKLCHKS